jgi:hypothetical protein
VTLAKRGNVGASKARKHPHLCDGDWADCLYGGAQRMSCVPHPATIPPSAYVFGGGGECDFCGITFDPVYNPHTWRERALRAAAREECDWLTPGEYFVRYCTAFGPLQARCAP